ncbi:MAG: hypothetical protein RIQ56_997 [Candidatus Parcubacteria bacterium]|jgi:uncharacterized protein with PQ loop repeat
MDHHVYKRKRKITGEPFPARTTWLRFLDRVVLAAGIIGPFSAIPQVLKIYIEGDASGLSAPTWGMWALLNIPWIIYGHVHRELPIVATYSLWFIVNTSVFLGILRFSS